MADQATTEEFTFTNYGAVAEDFDRDDLSTNADWLKAIAHLIQHENELSKVEGLTQEQLDSFLSGKIPEGDAGAQVAEALSDWGVSTMGQFNYNMLVTGLWAKDMASDSTSPATKEAFLYAMDTYDNMGMSFSGTGRLLKGLVTDPTTLVGIGTFGIGFAGKAAAKEGAAALLKVTLRESVIRGGIVAAIEGGVVGTADATMRESIEVSTGREEEMRASAILTGTVVGTGGGAILGSAAGAAIPAANRLFRPAAAAVDLAPREVAPLQRAAIPGGARVSPLGGLGHFEDRLAASVDGVEGIGSGRGTPPQPETSATGAAPKSAAEVQADQLRAQRERQAALNAGKTDEPQIEQPVQQQQANAGGNSTGFTKPADWDQLDEVAKGKHINAMFIKDADEAYQFMNSLDEVELDSLLDDLKAGTLKGYLQRLHADNPQKADTLVENIANDAVRARAEGYIKPDPQANSGAPPKVDPSADPAAKADASGSAKADADAHAKAKADANDVAKAGATSSLLGRTLKVRSWFHSGDIEVNKAAPDSNDWPTGKINMYNRNMAVATIKDSTYNDISPVLGGVGDGNFFRMENNVRRLEYGQTDVSNRVQIVTSLLQRGYIDAAIEGLRNAQIRNNLSPEMIQAIRAQHKPAGAITAEQLAFIEPIFKEGAGNTGKDVALKTHSWGPFGLGLNWTTTLRYPRTALWNFGYWLKGDKLPDNIGGEKTTNWIPSFKSDSAKGITGMDSGDFGNIGRIIGRAVGVATGITPTMKITNQIYSNVQYLKPTLGAVTAVWAITNGVDYYNDSQTSYSAIPDTIQMGVANGVLTTADTFSSIGIGASGLVFGQDAWPTQALDGWNGTIGWTQDTINGAEAAPETPAGDGLKRDMTTSGTGDQANAGATTTEQPAQKPQEEAAKETQTADASGATKDDEATLAGQTGTPVGGTPPVEPAAPGNGSGGNGGGGRTLQGRGRGSSTPTADGEGPGMAGAWDFIMPEEHDGAWDRNNYGQTVSDGLDAGKGLLSRGFNYVSDLYNHTIPTMVGEKNAPMAQLAMGGLMAWLALRFTTGAWTAATNISYGKIAIGLAAAVGIMHFMSGRKSEGFVFDGENTNSLERPSKTNNGNHTMNELRIGERPPLLSGSVQPFTGNPDDGLVRGESALDKAAGLSGSANATFSGGTAPVLPKAGDNDIVIKLDGDAAVQGGNSPHVPRGAGSTDFVDHNGSLDAVGIDQQRDFGPPYPPAAGSSAPASRFDHHAP